MHEVCEQVTKAVGFGDLGNRLVRITISYYTRPGLLSSPKSYCASAKGLVPLMRKTKAEAFNSFSLCETALNKGIYYKLIKNLSRLNKTKTL